MDTPLLKKKYVWGIFIIVLAYILIEARRQGDFWVFLEAAKRLQEGGDIYRKPFGDGFYFFYGTLFALLLIPFTYLPFYAVTLTWLFLGLFFVFRIWKLTKEYLNIKIFSEKELLLFIVLGWGFSFRFLYNNFHVIQMTIFLLYASLEGVTLILKDRKLAGAALLALAINFKTLPIVLVPYLLYRGQLKATCYVLLFIGIYLLIPGIFIGFDYNFFLIKQWWSIANPTRPIHVIDIDETGFHSLSAWLPTLLMENSANNFTLPLKRNVVNLDTQYVSFILTTLRLMLVSLTIYFLRPLPFKASPSKEHTFWEMSYIFLIIPLIFPHQHVYAFFLLLPAGIYIVYYFMKARISHSLSVSKPQYQIAGIITILSFFLLSIGGIIGFLDDFTEHYKFITYGALLLIIPLAILKPLNIKPESVAS